MAGEHGKKKRTCWLQKRGAGKHGGGPSGMATTQGSSIGHGSTNQGMLKILVRSSTWSNGGPTGARKQYTKGLSAAANVKGTQLYVVAASVTTWKRFARTDSLLISSRT